MKVVVDGSYVRLGRLVERSGIGYGRDSLEPAAVVRRSTDRGGDDYCVEMPGLERRSAAAEAAAVKEMLPLWVKVRLYHNARCLSTSVESRGLSHVQDRTIRSIVIFVHSYQNLYALRENVEKVVY